MKQAEDYMQGSPDDLIRWYETVYIPAAYEPANADASTKPPIFACILVALLDQQARRAAGEW